MANTYWLTGILLAVMCLGAGLYWLRGALYRFVDDGGLYSTYNGEQPYQPAATRVPLKRVASGKQTRPRLTLTKA